MLYYCDKIDTAHPRVPNIHQHLSFMMDADIRTPIRLALLDKCYEEGYPSNPATLTRSIYDQFGVAPVPNSIKTAMSTFYKVLQGDTPPPKWLRDHPEFAEKLKAVIQDFKYKERQGTLKRRSSAGLTIDKRVKLGESVEREEEQELDIPIHNMADIFHQALMDVKEEPSEDMEILQEPEAPQGFRKPSIENDKPIAHVAREEVAVEEPRIEETASHDSAQTIASTALIQNKESEQAPPVQKTYSEYFLNKLKYEIRAEEARKAREEHSRQIKDLKTTIFNMEMEADQTKMEMKIRDERIEELEVRVQFLEKEIESK